MMQRVERPLSQKEKALTLGVHPSTISAMTRCGLKRRATAQETVEWYRRHPEFRFRKAYPARDKV